ncbi:MAG: helix-turn-helix domain-containing protein [Alphaproteobacteria bacterium]|nr:helix-turn-helix domain-containing protein [Alphaproteobacteria bacterium]
MTMNSQNIYDDMKTAIDVSNFLKKVRLAKGVTIEDVSTHTKIRRVWLDCIESGEYDKLPGTVYAIGFVRTYATYLDLNADIVVKALQSSPEFTHHLPVHAHVKDGALFSFPYAKTVLSIIVILIMIASYLTLFKKESHLPNQAEADTELDSEIEDDMAD